MKKLLICAATAAALSGGAAHALVLTDSFNFPLSTTEINNTGQLDKFDSALGTLTSVTLTLDGQAVTTITMENTAAQGQRVEADARVRIFWSSDLGGLDLSAIILDMQMGTGLQVLAPGATASFGPLNDNDTFTQNPLASLFAAAPGGGTFNITCDSLSGLNTTGGGGNVVFSQVTQAGCGASISYDYIPRQTSVPEPGALALLGLGLLGLGVVRRRTR